ncbi:trihelix transcription factor DF1-like [Bidens hawaiensis]|uniref:trihelix transcription factor DF1-like n=1 Tax=Bidens hawaiensis TaxID=980011 RepID=UPI00404B7C6A
MMLQGIVSSSGGDVADSAHPSEISSAAAATTSAADKVSSGGLSEDEKGRVDDGSRNSGGNRWPRQETLALLKIRSDMDVVFRDSSLKGPLWDEVSRKLAELGYHRSAKKCKEKFENVYKYHKRTKEGRTSKADGKAYRFFDQLQALEGTPVTISHHQQPPVVSKPPQGVSPMASTQIQSIQSIMSNPNPNPNPTGAAPVNMTVSVSHPNNVDPISVAAPAVAMPTPMNINHVGGFPFSQMNMSASTNSSSSSTSSEDEPPERRRNRKRKWKEFFGKLMKEVVEKQEELQSKFIDTLERRERDRMVREEEWRMQEMAKMKREHELLVQERQMVAAKDAAVISFLQKITEQNPNVAIPQMSAMQLLHQQQQNLSPVPVPVPTPVLTPTPPPPPSPQIQQHQQQQPSTPITVTSAASAPASTPVQAYVSVSVPALPPSATKPHDNGGGGSSGGDNILQPSPSRWPKAEINALINLRTTLDTKYQENGPKGPLWEEISSAMRKLGYNRNAKRCKEKWENINKYYKKVKESSKKRPEDSKTCPYFHQLDAIYREKAASSSSNINSNINTNITTNNNPGSGFPVKPETQMAPIMARPEQQWPLQAAVQEQQQLSKQTQNDDYDDDDEEEEEEEEGGDYEIVPNKTSSMAAVE